MDNLYVTKGRRWELNMKRLLIVLLCICICGMPMSAYAKESIKSSSAAKRSNTENELHGVWIATVKHIDYPTIPTTNAKTLRNEIDRQVSDCKEMGFNTIFLQVRPNCDAIYPSALFPWSAYLTGNQGVAPDGGFDPLAHWIKTAHAKGMELHAWINPYRITSDGEKEWNAVSAKSPAKLHPEWVIQYTDGNYYFNPAIPEVRQLIEAGIMEIVNQYEVDGIHMDDYFYPGKDFPDEAYYAANNQQNFTSIADWRRNNVTTLVKEINQQVHAAKSDIQWGISPSGVWENKSANALGSNTQGGNPSYSKMYADTRLWATEGWIDYIAPQIYWNIGHEKADYAILLDWWTTTLAGSQTKLYIGLADYKAYQATETSVWYGGTELKKQMQMNADNGVVDGEIHFRYKLISEDTVLRKLITNKYKTLS